MFVGCQIDSDAVFRCHKSPVGSGASKCYALKHERRRQRARGQVVWRLRALPSRPVVRPNSIDAGVIVAER